MFSIEAQNLSKQFSYYTKEVGMKGSIKNLFNRNKLIKNAVNDISFKIEEGEIVGFLGPNGAGKTTTLKMLSGILYPSSGHAKVMGYVPWERKKNFKMQFSIIMGQKTQLWWDLPASESFYLNKHIYEIDDKQYNNMIGELSELLDVKNLLKVQVRRLSLGERMKMELIAALLHNPKVIFLDEPTIGLDIISQKKIREFLKCYNKNYKTTILLTSHYMDDIVDLCSRSIIINQGNIVFDGALNNINEAFNKKKILKLKFNQLIEKNDLAKFGLLRKYDGFNVEVEVDKNNVRELTKTIFDSLPVVDLNVEDIPIADVISEVYKS